jgi:hypothetical protein
MKSLFSPFFTTASIFLITISHLLCNHRKHCLSKILQCVPNLGQTWCSKAKNKLTWLPPTETDQFPITHHMSKSIRSHAVTSIQHAFSIYTIQFNYFSSHKLQRFHLRSRLQVSTCRCNQPAIFLARSISASSNQCVFVVTQIAPWLTNSRSPTHPPTYSEQRVDESHLFIIWITKHRR